MRDHLDGIDIREHEDGRISFPGVVQYRVRHADGTEEVLPWPPTARSHPAPAPPPPLTGWGVARLIAQGAIEPIPSSLPFTVEELDPAACRHLAASGLLYDPRHTGSPRAPAPAKG